MVDFGTCSIKNSKTSVKLNDSLNHISCLFKKRIPVEQKHLSCLHTNLCRTTANTSVKIKYYTVSLFVKVQAVKTRL